MKIKNFPLSIDNFVEKCFFSSNRHIFHIIFKFFMQNLSFSHNFPVFHKTFEFFTKYSNFSQKIHFFHKIFKFFIKYSNFSWNIKIFPKTFEIFFNFYEKIYILQNSTTLYGVVIYHAADCLPSPCTSTLGPYSNPHKLLLTLDRLEWVKFRRKEFFSEFTNEFSIFREILGKKNL